MFRVLLLTLALMSPAFQPISMIATSSANQPAYDKLSRLYEQPPVNAKVDRVWRAIPGLSGWKLDVDGSISASERAHDGYLHLKWEPVPPSRRLGDLPANPIYRGTDKEKSVCLMFNVSWGEEYVPDILAKLKQKGVHATFFLDGAWVKKNPELARKIKEAGHAIGSHGMGHPNFERLSDVNLQNQVHGTNQIIRNTLGMEPRLLAPPAGAFDARTVKIAHDAHMYTILWSVDSVDWRRPPASAILSRVMQRVEPGAFILMHPTAPTAEALPLLVQSLEEKGYHLKSVEQVIDEKPALVPPSRLSG